MGKILRRTFLIGSAAIVGGVAFGAWYVNRPYDNPLEDDLVDGEFTFNPFVKITSDNKVTIIAPRAEMGQGVHTSLAALVAEELDVAMDDIAVEHGPASSAYYNGAMLEEGAPFPHYRRDFMSDSVRGVMGTLGKVLGLQVTGGSSATIDAWEKMRQAGCAARETLKLAASEREGVSVAEVKTDNGHVVVGNTRIPYGDLVEAAAKLSPPSDMKLKDPSEWKIIGNSVPRVDIPAKSTGTAIYAGDIRLPDMVFATVRMNPYRGAPMKSMKTDAALKVPGVIKVVDMAGPASEILGGGYAVIASNTWAAMQGADAVDVEWSSNVDYPINEADQFKRVEEAFNSEDNILVSLDQGDTNLQFADADRSKVIEAEYRVPYLAHATMEPMNATAWLRDGRLDLWSGNQAPTIVLNDVAAEVGLEPENVEVHTTLMGGGFGRRGEIDFSRFAARIAKHTDGKPVSVVWSREEDMTHDFYRPMSIGRMRGLIGEDGLPQALEVTSATPSIIKNLLARTFPSLSAPGPDDTIAHGYKGQGYSIPHQKLQGREVDLSVPIGFWRSVGHTMNAWYLESFLDEMAHAAKVDPGEMRLALLKDQKPAFGVVEKVMEMSNWSAPKAEGRGKGIAYHLSFGAWVAEVVEVSLQSDETIKIENVWCACDLGPVVDPAIVKAQMQSGIIYGLSSALGQEITFADGMAQQSNFHDYDAMRIHQCPRIEVEIVRNTDLQGGAGEPGTPPSVPALANAIFSATGKRIRRMPLSKEVEFFA